jgi:hypothetical protein
VNPLIIGEFGLKREGYTSRGLAGSATTPHS